ncbi:MAG: hypothetical protein WCT50_01175 [Patescibacteria group bacterium]|jgi:hypothetical protein
MNKKIYLLLGGVVVVIALIIVIVSLQGDATVKPEVQKTGSLELNENKVETPEPKVIVETSIATTTGPKSVQVYTKPIELEFMTDADKATFGIPADIRVQVLGRDKEGKMMGYKIIHSDADIMTKYGN